MDVCLAGLRSKSTNEKEEILNLVTSLYNDYAFMIDYQCEKVVKEIAALLEDEKTKIKIKSVECLVVVTLKTNRELCKKLLSTLLNKVYYEMFLEKLQCKILDSTCLSS